MKASLYTDGGSRNNPGDAGIGYVLKSPVGEVLTKEGRYIGVKTNNEAEYTALIEGLKAAREKGVETLDCFLDSDLVVKQLNGQFKVKNSRLAELVLKVKILERDFKKVLYSHIPREENKEADGLVNEALDEYLGARDG